MVLTGNFVTAQPETLEFRDRLLAVPGFVEPDGFHHVFADGDHGQKFDWNACVNGMPAYEEARKRAGDRIHETGEPSHLLGTANGAIDITLDVVEYMQRRYNSHIAPLFTQKDPQTKKVSLSANARRNFWIV
jgi:hypothetical protein